MTINDYFKEWTSLKEPFYGKFEKKYSILVNFVAFFNP